MDDVGNYYCIAYYNKTTYGFPVEHRVWSNPGQAGLELAGINPIYHKTGNFGIVKLCRNLIQKILTKETLTKW